MERGRAQRAHRRCVPWGKYVDMRPSMAGAQETSKGDSNSTRGWHVRTQARRECDVRDADASLGQIYEDRNWWHDYGGRFASWQCSMSTVDAPKARLGALPEAWMLSRTFVRVAG